MEIIMVPLLAKQAVQIKCNFENAVMTGNYECAYALGIVSALTGQNKAEKYESILELKNNVLDNMGQYSTDDEKINRLLDMLKSYEPSGVIDEQMRELYSMGFDDKTI